ncbi:mammalian cell entry protein [Rhodococcus sp. WB1]|uniref:MlaD family protein n=1 Tax=Rhodococcus TaxID=1827 RepID=UPI0002D22CC9|nr:MULTISPECIES: MlaD family protein [Rhodococcus]ANZ23882.1 mammalian cell entry protein [Rhodococcus sp. WB1]PND53252.1 MCE family protein [Rhodococcus sp. ENV425]USC14328.1 MlaD family protein [Rhodococcus sp. 11-3]WFS15763.1 MlaD family protein [Rhodococcus aetherivorans]CCW09666.1 putative Mce family protein [Rhodococcus aetherivorans]
MNARAVFLATVLKLAIAAAVSALLFVLVISAMRSPVAGDTRTYTAEFSDVSGLGVNGDIRTRGVRIGKVEAIDLVTRQGSTIAEVRFSLQEPYVLTADTTLAVKYQNLTGVRYVDADFGEDSGVPVETLPLDRTRPSFDITELFNGLQPVLDTMSAEDINTFTENAIALLQGDGGGLKPMLDDAQKLADLAADREQVIATLTTNLARISDSMGGRSDEVVEFLRSMSFPIAKAMTVLDEFPKTATYGPEFLTPIKRLLDAYSLQPGANVEQMVAEAFSSLEETAEALRLLPSSVAGLQIPVGDSPGWEGCSKGVAQLPTEVDVLLNGSGVVVCSAR